MSSTSEALLTDLERFRLFADRILHSEMSGFLNGAHHLVIQQPTMIERAEIVNNNGNGNSGKLHSVPGMHIVDSAS